MTRTDVDTMICTLSAARADLTDSQRARLRQIADGARCHCLDGCSHANAPAPEPQQQGAQRGAPRPTAQS